MCLTNISFRQTSVNDYYDNFVYNYFGDSMTALHRRALFGGEIVEASKKDLKETLINILPTKGIIEGAPLFIVCPYASKEFIAVLKYNNLGADELTFEFLNPNKELFPDVKLHISDIRAAYAVVQIQKDLTISADCHCAVAGEYCGTGCINERQRKVSSND